MSNYLVFEKAYNKVFTAINQGVLIRPDTCELCGDKPTPTTYKKGGKIVTRPSIEAHHWNGHQHPLDVWFVCRECNKLLRGDKFHNGTVSKEQALEHIKSCKTQP